MFHFKKRGRRGDADDIRADIGDLAESGPAYGPEDEPADAEPAMASGDGCDGIPESIPQDERELMRDSRRSREAARERNRKDDQARQTVFACACVVAGFCGVAGVIFGTVAVCRGLSAGPGNAMASNGTVTAPYIQGVDPSDMNVYYDQSGRMHVNVYVSRQPDVDINIRIDGQGNVTSETVPRGDDADPAAAGQPGDGQPDDGGNGEAVPPADQAGTGDDGPSGENGENPGQGAEGGEQQPPADVPKTEQELLEEFNSRRENGGSGYLDSDCTYVVQRGDTLTKLSGMTGFSVDFLAYYNQLRDKNLIITGETLRYPAN